jgi:hypothetical protein
VIIVGAIVAGGTMQSFAAFGALTAAAVLYVIVGHRHVDVARDLRRGALHVRQDGEAPAGFDAAVLRARYARRSASGTS